MNFLKKVALEYLIGIGKELGDNREKTVRNFLPKGKDLKYLDLGCGDGKLSLKRAEVIGTDFIFGVEALEDLIDKANKKKINILKSNLNDKLPFEKETFNVITATQVIEHLYDVDTFVSEIYRILKPNGIFIVSTENLASWHNIAALIMGLQPSTGPLISAKFPIGFHPLYSEHIKDLKDHPYFKDMDIHTRVMAYRSFKKLFEKYNFLIVDQKTIGYYPFPSFLASFFSGIDPWHAVDMILKLKKI